MYIEYTLPVVVAVAGLVFSAACCNGKGLRLVLSRVYLVRLLPLLLSLLAAAECCKKAAAAVADPSSGIRIPGAAAAAVGRPPCGNETCAGKMLGTPKF